MSDETEMRNLFVFYQAHSQNGELRINNAVLRNQSCATIDDICHIEQMICHLNNYRDCKVAFWQRMEPPATTSIKGDHP